MSQDFQQHINNKTNKSKIRYLDISNNDLTGNADLKEFTSLTSLNAYNNQLENTDFLNSLTNKDKLTSINFFGNQIKELDLSHLISTFPNLKKINFGNNPLKAKNLDKLTAEQFGKIVDGIKNKSIQINSYKGTILMDLLTYANELVSKGNNNQQKNAQYLQTLIQQGSSPVKDNKQPSNNTPLLIGGLVVFGVATLAIGYLWGKKRKAQELEN